MLYLSETGEIQNYPIKIKKKYLNSDNAVRMDNENKLEFVDTYYVLNFEHTEPMGNISEILLSVSKAKIFN